MVAIVSGQGGGLLNTSAVNIGSAGVVGNALTSGQAGGLAHVNIATGNLILQFNDETMSGTGADLTQTRSYNSLGSTNDGDADNWRWNGEKSIRRSGDIVYRTTGDGHEATYTLIATNKWQTTTGSGAHDTITYSSTTNKYTWVEGTSKNVEVYSTTNSGSSSRYLIETLRDTNDNGFDYSYSAGKLTKIVDMESGQTIEFAYGPDGKLQELSTRETAIGTLTKQVTYDHDSYGRLKTVSTELFDGKGTYSTSYDYDSTSFRIKKISQSDGVRVSFTFDTSNRIKTVTDQTGTSTFNYYSDYTTVVNGAGETWRYDFHKTNSSNGEYLQLEKVTAPSVAGISQVAIYNTYDDGEIKSISDGNNHTITYNYDGNGNRISETDALGYTITRKYVDNLLMNETRTGESGSETTRFAYDVMRNLRYSVSAEGRVTEFEYNPSGLLHQTVKYAGATYNVSGLVSTDTISESTLNTWVNNLSTTNKANVELTQNLYDYRGNLSKVTEYATVSASGVGILDYSAKITEFVYSEHGQLLQTISVTGSSRTNRTTLESYQYDGMGRVHTAVSHNATTTTSYGTSDGVSDNGSEITVTNLATGLTTVSLTDFQGRLTSVTQSASGESNRVTSYGYDNAGRLTTTTNAEGKISYTYYNNAGQVEYQVDAEGGVVGYTYNNKGLVDIETRYHNAFNFTTETVLSNVSKDLKTRFEYNANGQVSKKFQVFTHTTRELVESTSFSDGLGVWTSTGSFMTRSGSTPSGNTGPSSASEGTHYLFMETSGGHSYYYGDTSTLESVSFNINTANLLEFDYHMYGQDMGTLYVEVYSGGSWNEVWRKTGEQQNDDSSAWSHEIIDLSGFSGSVQVRFRGVAAGGYRGDIALDNINLYKVSTASTLANGTSFSNGLGMWTTSGSFRVHSGGTSSGNTGPNNAAGGTHYIYMETSSGEAYYNGDTSTIESSSFTIDSMDLLEFDYHMYGQNVGTLFVEVYSDGRWQEVWTRGGQQHNGHTSAWTHESVDLRRFSGTVKVRFRGVAAGGYMGDIALDNINLHKINTQEVLTHENQYDASGRLIKAIHGGDRTSRVFYNKDGLKVGDLNAEGYLTEYVYDAVGRVTQTVRYSAQVPGSTATSGSFTSVKSVADNSAELYSYNFYDSQGRLIGHVNEQGFLTETIYQPAQKQKITFEYMTAVNAAGKTLNQLVGQADVDGQRTTTVKFDDFGRVYQTINADGSKVTNYYDSASRLIRTLETFDTIGLDYESEEFASFETALGTELFTSTGDFDWVRNSGGTSSGNTGPSSAKYGSNYVYMETSSGAAHYVGNKAILESGVIPSTDRSELEFYYHMYGADMGTLSVEVYHGNEWKKVWSISGQQQTSSSEAWRQATINLGQYTGDIKVRFVGEAAGGYMGDMALDSIYIADRVTTEHGGSINNFNQYNAFGEIVGNINGDAAVGVSTSNLQTAIDDRGTRFELDNLGRTIAEFGAEGQKTYYFYDNAGRITYTVNALGEVAQTVYNKQGLVVETRIYTTRMVSVNIAGLTGGHESLVINKVSQTNSGDSQDNVVSIHYNQLGQIISKSDAKGNITTNFYNKYGEVWRSKNSLINTSGVTERHYTYDNLGRAIQISLGTNQTSTQYDGFGRVKSVTNGNNETTYNAYNQNGREIVVTNATGSSSKTTYDAIGRKLSVTDAYNNTTEFEYQENYGVTTVKMTSPEGVITRSYLDTRGNTMMVKDANGGETIYEYNNDGQLEKVTDSLGFVSENKFDNSGRLIEAYDAKGNITRYEYDAANRVVNKIQDYGDNTKLNTKTNYQFDGQGRKFRVIEGAGSSSQKITDYKFYADGRIKQIIEDPYVIQASTRFTYDESGNTVRVEKGNLSSPALQVTDYEFDKSGRKTKEILDPNGLALTTEYRYDNAGNLTHKINANGSLTQYHYNAVGLKTREIVDPSGLAITTQYHYDNNGNLTRVINPNGASTWYVYNNDGQKIQTITETRVSGSSTYASVITHSYDKLGNVYQTLHHTGELNVTNWSNVDKVSKQTIGDSSADRETISVYDAAGRLRFNMRPVYEAEWAVTENRYDGNGNVIAIIEYAGSISGDDLDSADANRTDGVSGDFITEAEMTQFIAANKLGSWAVSNARTTQFEYDALGRQVKTILPGWYDSTDKQVYANKEGQSQRFQRYIEVTYDSLGNEVKSSTRVGQVDFVSEYKTYDAIGRVVHEIDAVGGVTQYDYNELGQLASTVRYNDFITETEPSVGYWTVDSITVVADTSKDRKITFEYDAAGRKSKVLQPQSYAAMYVNVSQTANANSQSVSAYSDQATTEYYYDKVGNITKERVQIDSGSWAESFHYYDKANRKVLTVDPMKYGTKFEYDDAGNIEKTTEYYTALSSGYTVTEASQPTFSSHDLDKDRITRNVYDKAGRVLEIYQDKAIYTSSQTASRQTNATIQIASYQYNSFGEVSSSTISGATTNYVYNNGGKLWEVAAPSRHVTTTYTLSGLKTVSPLTSTQYNVFGEVVSESHQSSGSGQIYTSYQYDNAGNLISVVDPEGHTQTKEYDVSGRVIAEQTIVNASTGEKIRTEYQYDNVGQQILTLNVFTQDDTKYKSGQKSDYNAFGEITEKYLAYGTSGSLTQKIASYVYDRSGLIQYQRDSQGYTYYFYDLTGQVTRQEQRGGTTSNNADTRVSEWFRDKLGNVLTERTPKYQGLIDATNSDTQVTFNPKATYLYDRWGNATKVTKYSGHSSVAARVTDYEYDHQNRVIKETLPTTSRTTAVAGTSSLTTASTTSVRLQKHYHYDIQGNLIRQAEGLSGNETVKRFRYYNAVGQLVKETDATGNSTEYGYDEHGRQVVRKNALGREYKTTYDKRGLQTGTYFTSGNEQITRIEYDAAGRKVKEYDALNNAQSYKYDERGNRTQIISKNGNVTTYEYDLKGNKETEEYNISSAASQKSTWTYYTGSYAAGRLYTANKAGTLGTQTTNHHTEYLYDGFGQLEIEKYNNPTNGVTNQKTYDYKHNGLLAKIEHSVGWSDSRGYQYDTYSNRYEYDGFGNKVIEEVIDEQDAHYVTETRYETYSTDYDTDLVWTTHDITISRDAKSVTLTRSKYDEHNRLAKVESPKMQKIVASGAAEHNYLICHINTMSMAIVFKLLAPIKSLILIV
ncbi:DUF6531 domain-containing protein [Catenovulum sediminis]|uniref:DUF6531 domain-containing protein n=1 Tax=Catenovulum sediminis TaxID=1740262 RepID=UPI00117D898F|nr:DUF6531 domain-containing protein [Catenovulum sediminis]